MSKLDTSVEVLESSAYVLIGSGGMTDQHLSIAHFFDGGVPQPTFDGAGP